MTVHCKLFGDGMVWYVVFGWNGDGAVNVDVVRSLCFENGRVSDLIGCSMWLGFE